VHWLVCYTAMLPLTINKGFEPFGASQTWTHTFFTAAYSNKICELFH
jgi:hypothetical protein